MREFHLNGQHILQFTSYPVSVRCLSHKAYTNLLCICISKRLSNIVAGWNSFFTETKSKISEIHHLNVYNSGQTIKSLEGEQIFINVARLMARIKSIISPKKANEVEILFTNVPVVVEVTARL